MLESWKQLGIFQPVRLPPADVHKLALGAFGSIATMNLSLAANSIGVYQVSMCILLRLRAHEQFKCLNCNFNHRIVGGVPRQSTSMAGCWDTVVAPCADLNGIPQMGKLSCIPYMVFYQSTFLGTSFSTETKCALTAVFVGMAIAVVTDVHQRCRLSVRCCLCSHYITFPNSMF